MKKNYSYCFALLCFVITASITNANAQVIIGEDNASSYTTESWQQWMPGGSPGFSPWFMQINGDNENGVAGFEIGSSTAAGFGNVNTDNKAFCMYGYKQDTLNPDFEEAVVRRYFTSTGNSSIIDNRTPLMPGQEFSIDFAIARRNGFKGIDLITDDGQFLWNFGMDGDRRYQVNGVDIFSNQYIQQSVFEIKAYQLTTSTYKVTITRGTQTWDSPVYDGCVGGFKIYIGQTISSSPLNRLYFNNLKTVQCPEETTWDGTTWSNGEPEIYKRVTIKGNYTSGTSISACTLMVNNGAVVTIQTGHTLTVAHTIDVEDGASLTIENNAALVQHDKNAVNNDDITVKRDSNELFKLDYTLWGSPVAGQQLQAFSENTVSSRFYTYAYNWSATVTPQAYRELYWTADATQNFIPGKGYLIRMPNVVVDNAGYNAGTSEYTYPGSFTGAPNNGDITIGITQNNFNTTEGEPAILSQAGHYIAVGNPYASPISVYEFFKQNEGVIAPGNGIYFWRKKNDSEASSYSCLTMAAFTANEALGGNLNSEYYTSFDEDIYNQNWIISPGQGFLVKIDAAAANSAVVKFTNTMRKPAGIAGQPFFKTANNDSTPARSRMWLNLTNTNNAFSQAAIVYASEATLGLDYALDGKAMSGGNAKLYSVAEATNLSVQARPAFEAADVVPMGLTVSAAGQYTITLDHVDGIFSTGQDIYLKDNLNGTTANLSQNPYIFTTDVGTFDTRFQVVYAPSGSLGTQTPDLANTVVYQKDNTINITTGTIEMTAVAVYDMRGRVLYTKDGINATEATINGLNVAHQVLIVEINTLNGKVSKKILY